MMSKRRKALLKLRRKQARIIKSAIPSGHTHSAGQILDDASAATGWNDDSKIAVLLDYIEDQEGNRSFSSYIARRVRAELDM